MGKSQSKDKEAPKEVPAEPVEKDNRWELSRKRTAKYGEYFSKQAEIYAKELKRPIGNSTYWRELPFYQGYWGSLALIAVFWRKLPFTNPFARVLMLLLGVDACRSRARNITLANWETTKTRKQFDVMHRMLTLQRELRLPDYEEEWEEWYLMNKPAYRVPVPWEYTLSSYMRFYLVNRKKYGLRNVEWEGNWEQEISLNMDLYAPHADHWLTVH